MKRIPNRILRRIRRFSESIRRAIGLESKSDLESELSFHLDELTRSKVADGMDAGEARRQALIDLAEWSRRGKRQAGSAPDISQRRSSRMRAMRGAAFGAIQDSPSQ